VLLPNVFFGKMHDSLILTRATANYARLIGKRILKINGIKADSIICAVQQIMNIPHEGFIESMDEYHNLALFWSDYFNFYPAYEGDSLKMSFFDSEETIPFNIKRNNVSVPILPKWNYHSPNKINYSIKKLNAETALLDVNTFILWQKDEEDIAHFIKEISDSAYKNLIIDLRNNQGGHVSCLSKLFALIAKEPFKITISEMVNSSGRYNFFRNTTNFSSEDILFSNYAKIPGKVGYFIPEDSIKLYEPNDSIHFDGNVIVLTNEFSLSAASLFAGLVHKYHRGINVGRETGTCYHQMNADKFAIVLLINTALQLRFPLIKTVFDTSKESDIPFGRGVLPDYDIKLSIEELSNSDQYMIDSTLAIIDEVNNLKPIEAKTKNAINTNGLLIFGFLLGLMVIGIIRFHKH
jgi:hypothetical protein